MKVYTAIVNEFTYDEKMDHYSHTQVFAKKENAWNWAKQKAFDICNEYVDDEDCIILQWGDEDKREQGQHGVSYNVEEQELTDLEEDNDEYDNNQVTLSMDYMPTVVASIDDFIKYDLSGLSDEEKLQMVEEVAKGMNNNDNVMECYWLHVELAAEKHGLTEIEEKD